MNKIAMDGHLNLQQKALQATWLRNQVINQNMANNDTPDYKRRDVKFEDYLRRAMDFDGQLSSDAVEGIQPSIFVDKRSVSYRLDGNNVNIDTEMAYSAENQIRYNALVSQVNYRFRRLKEVMN